MENRMETTTIGIGCRLPEFLRAVSRWNPTREGDDD